MCQIKRIAQVAKVANQISSIRHAYWQQLPRIASRDLFTTRELFFLLLLCNCSNSSSCLLLPPFCNFACSCDCNCNCSGNLQAARLFPLCVTCTFMRVCVCSGVCVLGVHVIALVAVCVRLHQFQLLFAPLALINAHNFTTFSSSSAGSKHVCACLCLSGRVHACVCVCSELCVIFSWRCALLFTAPR